jgi:hypothetical protein
MSAKVFPPTRRHPWHSAANLPLEITKHCEILRIFAGIAAALKMLPGIGDEM